MRLSYYRWFFPIPAAFVLQAVYGLLFADGVFVSILNDVVLTKAIGLFALFSALGITLFGVLLANASDPTRYRQVPRMIAILGSFGVSAQALMAYGLYIQSPAHVYTGAIIVGIGSGCVYVVSIVVIQAWVPESPGMATGVGLLIGGAGSLFGICAFQILTESMGSPLTAMGSSGLVAGLVSVSAAMFIERPPTGWSPMAERNEKDFQTSVDIPSKLVACDDSQGSFTSLPMYSDETKSLLPHKDTPSPLPESRLSIIDILCDPAFSLVFISVFAAVGPGFGFVIAFPRMANVLFAIDMATANTLLFWVSLVSVLGRIAIGLAIDLQTGSDTSVNSFMGAKRINTMLLAVQSTALASMPILIRYGWIQLFAVATALVLVTFNGGAVISACLARSIFSPENSTMAFALLGIAIGVGRALFSIALASCGDAAVVGMVKTFGGRRIFEYDYYVQLAFVVSTFGLIMSYYIKPSKAAYAHKLNNPVFAT